MRRGRKDLRSLSSAGVLGATDAPRPVFKVGVISDTHGWLAGSVADVFAGVDHIVHAGDVGSYDVLAELEAIAPVTAVRGNMDVDDLGGVLVPMANVRLGGARVLVVHRPQDVPRPLPAGIRVVVNGHTHAPRIETEDGVLHVDPGSASRPDSGKARSAAILSIAGGTVDGRIVVLP
jgi:putative phosphoesterase